MRKRYTGLPQGSAKQTTSGEANEAGENTKEGIVVQILSTSTLSFVQV